MRKIHIDRIDEGIKIARNIFDSEGRILLSAGIGFKSIYKERLKACGIKEIFIEDSISKGIEVKDVLCEETRLEAKMCVKNSLKKFVDSNSINEKYIKEIVDKIIDELFENDSIIISLSDIKSVDEYTFEHSVNVCILSLIIGIGFGYNINCLRDLGVGALLHDIGKLKIPKEILNKTKQLTVAEFEEVKRHTEYGFEILKSNENISMVSSYIAYSHHERYDGSGYPDRLKSDSIHEYSRIVAVSDVYDALTSDRVYRKKLCASEVFEYITSLGAHHFDKKVIDVFVKSVAVYPPGMGVVLNTGEKGLVVRVNKDMPTRPVIRLVFNKFGNKNSKDCEIDLSKNLNVCVVDMCDI